MGRIIEVCMYYFVYLFSLVTLLFIDSYYQKTREKKKLLIYMCVAWALPFFVFYFLRYDYGYAIIAAALTGMALSGMYVSFYFFFNGFMKKRFSVFLVLLFWMNSILYTIGGVKDYDFFYVFRNIHLTLDIWFIISLLRICAIIILINIFNSLLHKLRNTMKKRKTI